MKEDDSNQPRIKVVRDHLGVDLLMNLTAARRLAPFMRAEQTLGSAAAEVDVPASSLAYWVGRFVRAGLVEVVRTEPRAGKPIPVYRAVADEFRIPLDAMPPGSEDALLAGGRRHMFDEFTGAVNRAARPWIANGLRLRSHPDRGMELGFVEPDRTDLPPVTEWWATVTMTDDEAAEVRRLLDDIAARFGKDHEGPGRKRYVTVLGIAPLGRR
jgi:hypothetical protein